MRDKSKKQPASGRDRHREPTDRRREREADGPVRIYGIHAVEAALLNPARQILTVRLTDNAENRLAEPMKSRGIVHERVHPRDLDRALGTETVHQGAAIEVELLPEPTLEELADRAAIGGPLVVLDQVTDPHNVGAILRSAAAFGASGLVMTRRNSPPLSDALAKAASGALEVVPVALVPNLARALDQLGDLAIMRIGLDGEATETIESRKLGAGLALVFGAEGKGLRRLTREHCDALCRISTVGFGASLNVSNAAAIALHAAALQRAN